MIDSDIHRLTI